MKKLLLLNVFVTIFAVSLNFAADEGPGRRIHISQAIARFSGPLTREQQHELRERLQAAAAVNDDGRVYVADAQEIYESLLAEGGGPMEAGPAPAGQAAVVEAGEKGESESEEEIKESGVRKEGKKPGKKMAGQKKGGVEDILRTKKAELTRGAPELIPSAVLEHIGSFLPAGDVPLDWNIAFPKGKKILTFATIKERMLESNKSMGGSSLAVSADGRYIALGCINATSEVEILVWDMQNRSQKPKKIALDARAHFHGFGMAFGSKGMFAYYDAGRDVRYEDYLLRAVDVKTGQNFWNKLSIDPASFNLAFSHDGNYLITERWVVRDARTGDYLNDKNGRDVISGAWDDQKETYSFDGTKRAVIRSKPRGFGSIEVVEFEEREGGSWAPYGQQIELSPVRRKAFDRMSLSPNGRRVCLMQEIDDRYTIRVFDVMTGRAVVLEEGISGWVSLVTSLTGRSANLHSLGVSFSPSGRYVMWAMEDRNKGNITIKIADLEQFFGEAEEYEIAEADIRRARELEKAGFKEGVQEF